CGSIPFTPAHGRWASSFLVWLLGVSTPGYGSNASGARYMRTMTKMMIWNEIGLLLFPFGVGIACAAFYFGGIRWTLQRVATRSGAAQYLLLSFLIRSVIVLAAFYLAANGRWQHVLASMAGF